KGAMKKWWTWLVVIGSGLYGCGPSEPAPVPGSGGVRLGGAPLPSGEIYFVGRDGSVPEGGAINEGKYSLKARPGSKRVEIRAFRRVEPPPPKKIDPMQNYIPDKYNADTTLSAEVTVAGPNYFEYDLQSK